MKLNLKRIVSYGLPVFVLIVLCYSPSIASTDYSPTEGWRTSTPEKQGIDSGDRNDDNNPKNGSSFR